MENCATISSQQARPPCSITCRDQVCVARQQYVRVFSMRRCPHTKSRIDTSQCSMRQTAVATFPQGILRIATPLHLPEIVAKQVCFGFIFFCFSQDSPPVSVGFTQHIWDSLTTLPYKNFSYANRDTLIIKLIFKFNLWMNFFQFRNRHTMNVNSNSFIKKISMRHVVLFSKKYSWITKRLIGF